MSGEGCCQGLRPGKGSSPFECSDGTSFCRGGGEALQCGCAPLRVAPEVHGVGEGGEGRGCSRDRRAVVTAGVLVITTQRPRAPPGLPVSGRARTTF